MDPKGYPFPVIVMACGLAGLWWHFLRARKGEAGGRDRWMGALWAALVVIAGARVLMLVAGAGEPPPLNVEPPRTGTK